MIYSCIYQNVATFQYEGPIGAITEMCDFETQNRPLLLRYGTTKCIKLFVSATKPPIQMDVVFLEFQLYRIVVWSFMQQCVKLLRYWCIYIYINICPYIV